MTFEEAKKIFLNRGYVEVSGGTYYDADKWREAITVISKWLEQEPCEDAISRECNNCAYYVNGANDEACDGCFEDVYEHPNFKPKARHCDDAVSRCAVLDTLDKMDKALDDDRSVESYKALLTECYKDLPPVMSKEKIGKWIDSKDWIERRFDSMNFRKHCSLCDHIGNIQDNFCSNCGARMVSE